jgi:uncharacterized protein (TIGR03435 family)
MAAKLFTLATVVCALLAAQSFDVVSVRPNTTGSGGSSERTNPGHVMAENITASSMIQQAFGVRASQIEGAPAWIETDKYDLQATTGTTKDLNDVELQPYWESLLTTRFRMKYHRASKEMQIYSLTLAKGGAKLPENTSGGDTSTHLTKNAKHASLTSAHIEMPQFAVLLGKRLDRTVIDKTGLTGIYDVKLEWSPDLSTDTGSASIFTALQDQLGLKLESGRGPVAIIVIDSIERPTEN